MWPFSETNAAAMRTLKTPVYAESSAQSGEEHLPAWKRETKDQQGVTVALTLFVKCRSWNIGITNDARRIAAMKSLNS